MTRERFERRLGLRAMLWLGILAGGALPRETAVYFVAAFLLLVVLLSVKDWRTVTDKENEG